MGPGIERDNQLGALVSAAERDKVAELVTTAVAEGAKVTLGGAPSDRGAFYPPTVLVGVEHGSTINQTEIFGPVSAIVGYDEVDEAVRMANDTIYGLIAYVYGPDGDALRAARRIDSGMVAVNRAVLSDPAAPFGGMKQSGLGREGGSEGILEFLEEKYIGIELN
jgi:succinate-semialdehyde dehydrogenase / glutarate-semialdehyde dehydrogenase